jgi:transmembrane sensor
MKERTDRIAALLEKSLREGLTPEEKKELDLWLSEGNENKALYQQMMDQGQLLEKLRVYDLANSEAMWQKTMSRVNTGGKVVSISEKKISWRNIAAAAVLVGVLATGAVWFLFNRQDAEPVAKTEETTVPVKKKEIVPGGNYAKLVLADGKTIQLDQVPDGALSNQGNMSLSKADGHLTYSGRFITSGPVSTGAEKHASLHNMVSTPRGGQYQLTLPDGSKVRLNAASSLRFPLAFAGNQRVVEVTGEAYFEVSKLSMPGSASQKIPFIVKIIKPGGVHEVEVLGTEFNVKAYPEEGEDIRTTLKEGSVRVRENGVIAMLQPGQQAIAQNGELKVTDADVDDAIQWTEGMFPASGTAEVIMNQIARWYDIEISFEHVSLKKESFNVAIPMKNPFEDMRKALESQGIQTKLENRKLIVIQ